VTATPSPAPREALATFGGGCFWCTEAVFSRLAGVLRVTPGYAGGHDDDPTYEEVVMGETGHAEVVQVRYDPAKVAYADLLEVFFATHDPTTLNQQGVDVGTHYRSLVLWHDEAQKAEAERVVKALDASGAFPDPIVTEIAPYRAFYPAEAYHVDYYARNGREPYCQRVIRPKVEKLEKAFGDRLR